MVRDTPFRTFVIIHKGLLLFRQGGSEIEPVGQIVGNIISSRLDGRNRRWFLPTCSFEPWINWLILTVWIRYDPFEWGASRCVELRVRLI